MATGLLGDYLSDDANKREAQKAGLINFGAQLLMNQDSNFGSALGRGLIGGSNAYQGTLQDQQKQALQAAQMNRQALEGRVLQQQLDQPGQIAGIISSVGGQPQQQPISSAVNGLPPQQMPTAQPQELPQSVVRVPQPSWLSQTAAVEQQAPVTAQTQSVPQQPAPVPPQSVYQRYMQIGDALAQKGFTDQANKYYDLATKLQPKLKNQTQLKDSSGKVVTANVYEDGRTEAVDGYTPAEKLSFQNTGGSTVALDPFTGLPVNTIRNTQSPDNAATTAVTMRGQNMIDARTREANTIAAGGKATENATNLRKEFEVLPEVKNYKQALPAYTSIVDAAKRNTPQADINLVYGIAKLYDPNSVVREGEYATVANSPNIPERVKGYAQYLAGGGKLSPQTKAQIVAEAKSRIGSYETEYTKVRDDYGVIADRAGVDKSQLFPNKQKPAATVPQTGYVQDGYVFQGGDPSNKANWVKR